MRISEFLEFRPTNLLNEPESISISWQKELGKITRLAFFFFFFEGVMIKLSLNSESESWVTPVDSSHL